MNIEYPAAFAFIFQDDLYLSDGDREIYKKNNIELADFEPTPIQLNYLGGNKKQFLIIVHYLAEEFIKGDHLTALQSILKRMDFTMDDVAIFNIAKHPGIHLAELTEFFSPNKLLSLGNGALPTGIEAIALNVPVVLNNINILYSFSFDEMMDTTSNKKVFWEQVKRL